MHTVVFTSKVLRASVGVSVIVLCSDAASAVVVNVRVLPPPLPCSKVLFDTGSVRAPARVAVAALPTCTALARASPCHHHQLTAMVQNLHACML